MSASMIREKPVSLGSIRQHSITHTQSPLKLFTHAKTTIADIYRSLGSYVNDTNAYLTEVINFDEDLVGRDRYNDVQRLKGKISGIGSIITRDHMKVVFSGRTSNGKSTVINSMIRERIVPVGIGHTTNCFLQIEGTDKADPFLLLPDSVGPRNLNSLNDVSSALSKEKLDSDSLVKIFWPREKCRLIRDDVVLVDSPGLDVSTNLDQWIETHCLDADVFVLVISAEATIAGAEKKFFHTVAERLSNPNVFILMNRWDAADHEPDTIDSVRQQHVERGVEFLCDELHLCDRTEASEHRIFFISAREALLSRSTESTSAAKITFTEGYKERLIEFNRFEHDFEKCLSKSAVRTKFGQHTIRAKEIVLFLMDTFTSLLHSCETVKRERLGELAETNEKHSRLKSELLSTMESTRQRIQHLTENVYKSVAQIFNDEIKRLDALVNEFDRPFSSDPEQIPLYKEALHQWIDERLASHLQHRLHPALHRALDAFYRDVNERVKSMVFTDEQKLAVTRIVPRSDFNIFYRLDCSNLCSHFREDIRFKFSLSIFSPWHHWSQHLSPRSLTDLDDDKRSMKPTSSVLTSKSWLLAFGIGGLVWCGLDWKIVASVASMYGGVYLYERLMWTRKAQERAFQRQYVDYVSSHMRRIVDLTAGNASAQVQRELTMYSDQTLRHVQLEKDALVQRIQRSKHGLDHLECLMAKGKKISKQGDQISHELDQFARRCL